MNLHIRSLNSSPTLSLTELAGRVRRHTHFRVVVSYGISQGVVLLTSLARIPLIVSAIGSDGYGVAIAVSSLQAWVVLVIASLPHLTRVSVSECLARNDIPGALQTFSDMRRRAKQLALVLFGFGILLAISLPWSQLLHAQGVTSSLGLRFGICLCVWLSACSVPGSIYLGLLEANRRIALTQSFIGMAGLLSLAATAVGWAIHLGLVPFLIAPALAACAPFWLAQVWGRRQVRVFKAQMSEDTLQTPRHANTLLVRQHRPRDFLVMSGAAAPPLFSTGLDPIVLSIATGPVVVAAYGLASRIGLLVTVLPSALYPLYWANFSRLRVAGDLERIRQTYRKELIPVVAGTVVLGIIFVAAGPHLAALLSAGKVQRPMLLYCSVAILGVFSAVQTITLPLLGGTKTAPRVALLVFGLIIPNEFLSYFLSRLVGAAGPILASIAASLTLLGACFFMLWRDPHCVLERAPVTASLGTANE